MRSGIFAAVFGTLLMLTGSVFAESLQARNEVGLGFVLGQPTGVRGEFYWGPKQSIAATAAWAFNDWFMAIGDLKFHNYIPNSAREWTWSYGVGAYLAVPRNDQGTFGVRVPLELRYRIPHSAVDVYGEVAPALRLVPETVAQFQGGLGVTFWLK